LGKKINEIGKRYGRLTVLHEDGRGENGKIMWLCQCDCGGTTTARGDALRNGATKSCGCATTKIDLIGQRFGRLTVLRESGRNRDGRVLWLCQCICGNESIVTGCSLRRGHTKSCGCIRTERASKLNRLGPGEASKNALYRSYKHSAKKRGFSFELTQEEFIKITQQDCRYCGDPPSQIARYRESTGVYVYNGIDRVDNTRGYTVSNSVPCCKTCNSAKGTLSLEEFLMWVDRLKNHKEKREYFT